MVEQLVQGEATVGRQGYREPSNRVIRIMLSAFLVALLAATASASHFRFGHLSWQRAGGGQTNNTVEITVLEAWRAGAGGVGEIDYIFDYNNQRFTSAGASQIGTLTDITGEQYALYRRIVSHTFPSNGVYTLTSSPTVRLATLENAPASQATMKMVMDVRPSNTGTPTTLSPVILQLPIDTTNSVAIPLVDPDGDPISVRLATAAESGIPNLPAIGTNQLTVTTNGVLNWNTAGGAVSNRYAAQLIIEENHPGFTTTGEVPLEFIIELISVAANERPTCTGPVGAQLAGVGTPFQAAITASDPEGQPLTVKAQQLPDGAVLQPADGSTINSGTTVAIEWVPGEQQLGQTFPVVLVFTDNGGLQTNCSFTINVSSQLPLPRFGLVSPLAGTTDTTANGASAHPAISEFGRYVVFSSAAADLASNDANNKLDVFRRDRARGTTDLISVTSAGVSGNGDSVNAVVSPDGRYVAFQSRAANLVSGDINGELDVFVRDTLRNETVLVSRKLASATSGSGFSFSPVFAGDSNLVFTSTADDLVSGDTNGTSDVFVRNLASGTTTLVSVSTNGTSGNGPSSAPVVTANGQYIAFQSSASDLVANDTNNTTDIFVRNVVNPRCVAVSVNAAGNTANGISFDPAIAINRDLVFVAFASQSTDLVSTSDTNQRLDVFVRELSTQTNLLVSRNLAGTATGNAGSSTPVFSADGKGLLFVSTATDLTANDANGKQDVFLWRLLDLPTGSGPPLPGTIPDQAMELISVNHGGTSTANGASGVTAASMSADLRFVAFVSEANDLTTGGADTNGFADVYVRDRSAGVTRLISYDPINQQIGNGNSYAPYITANGEVIVFATDASNLATVDTNSATDIVAISTTNVLPSSLSAAVHVTAPDSRPAGVDFPVTIHAANLSQQGFNTLRVANLVSSSLTQHAVSASHGNFDWESGVWTLGNLMDSEVATLNLTVSGNQSGSARVAASIVPPSPFAPIDGEPDHDVTVTIEAPLQFQFFGPVAYDGISDSPWSASLTTGQTRLEDFEDGSLDFGISVGGALIRSGGPESSAVENEGRSLEDANDLNIAFNASVLGAHPDRVGLAVTAISGDVTFEAWDGEGRKLGTLNPFSAMTHQFVGISSSHGISRIRITASGRINVDHLQYTLHSGIALPDGLALWAKGDSGSRSTPGRIGRAYATDAMSGGVTIQSPIVGELSSAAVEFWFRADHPLDSDTTWTPLAIMSPTGQDISAGAHGLDVYYSAGQLWFTASTSGGSVRSALSHTTDFAAGSWHHVAGVVTANGQQLFLDGRRIATNSLNGPVHFSSAPAQLGQGWLEGTASYFDGAIDEYSLYQSALDEETITALFRESRRGKVRPALSVTHQGSLMLLEWPSFFKGYGAQMAARIDDNPLWVDLIAEPVLHDGRRRITLASNPNVPYYRLVRRNTNPQR